MLVDGPSIFRSIWSMILFLKGVNISDSMKYYLISFTSNDDDVVFRHELEYKSLVVILW